LGVKSAKADEGGVGYDFLSLERVLLRNEKKDGKRVKSFRRCSVGAEKLRIRRHVRERRRKSILKVSHRAFLKGEHV